VPTSPQQLLVEAFPSCVDISQDTLHSAQADKSGQASDSMPLAVASPDTVEQLQEVVAFAHRHLIPIVPRGGGSGLAGGAIGHTGQLVLSTHRLNRILELSQDDRLAVVEAGVINSDLNDTAHKSGLWFAPDPASRQWSTVGGNIATNAGGLMCAKYGVTRESVLALDVVLADGRLISIGHRSVKGVTGFDLCNLMIGSEGMLGIIVRATVKLMPLSPHPTWTVSATFDSLDAATTACSSVTAKALTPAVLELVDHKALGHIHSYLGRPEDSTESVLLIAQTDGPGALADSEAIEGLCSALGAHTERFPAGDQAEALLSQRRAMHPAMEAQGTVLIEDVSVPRSQMASMFAEIRRIERDYDVSIPTVAHAADGNLHPNFIYTGDEVPKRIWEAASDLFRSALTLGGTLTGEHGVGRLKRRWLKDELGNDVWQLQREIKAVFDPQGLLNPGVMFENESA
jgi:glycolate oxidase